MGWWSTEPELDTLLEALDCMLRLGAKEYTVDPNAALVDLFDAQRAFVVDEHPHKALLKGRRAGGTYAIIRHLWYTAIRKPNTCALYLALNRKMAKALVWEPLKYLNRTLLLGARSNETELIIYLPNGSTIMVSGCDKMSDTEKFRGPSYSVVILDEAASFKSQHIDYILKEIAGPALKENAGSLVMVGTPGRALFGSFYEATAGRQKSYYSQHFWTAVDNPRFPLWRERADWKQYAQRCLTKWCKEEGFYSKKDPRFKREYLGQWVKDTDWLVYNYDPEVNGYDGSVPKTLTKHILGVDLGYEDKCAFVDISWSPYSNEIYLHNIHHEQYLDTEQVAHIIKERMDDRYYIDCVCDTGGLGKFIVEDINKRHKLNIKAAKKSRKRDFIALMNTDLIRGVLKVHKDDVWAEQASKVVWDRTRTREAEGQPCDVLDAALYAYRESFAYLVRKPEEKSEEDLLWERDEYERGLSSAEDPFTF